MRCLKVAFGMEDDEHLIDTHYGDSEFFVIYEICEDGSYKLLEKRHNRAKDMGEEEHGDPKKFKAVVSQLLNVDVLAAFRMGPNFLRIRDSSRRSPSFLPSMPSLRSSSTRGLGLGFLLSNPWNVHNFIRSHTLVPLLHSGLEGLLEGETPHKGVLLKGKAPIYSIWGFLVVPGFSMLFGGFILLLPLVYWAGVLGFISEEEKALAERFGNEWRRYAERTPRFLPGP